VLPQPTWQWLPPPPAAACGSQPPFPLQQATHPHPCSYRNHRCRRVDLEIIRRSGSDHEVWLVERVEPVLARPHFLLATLLLCNSAAMETLPLFLDRLLNPVAAIILSGGWRAVMGGSLRSAAWACLQLPPHQLVMLLAAEALVDLLLCLPLAPHYCPAAVSAILVFGEIVPQAVCKRYGLQASKRAVLWLPAWPLLWLPGTRRGSAAGALVLS
jgi:hypothetical protein